MYRFFVKYETEIIVVAFVITLVVAIADIVGTIKINSMNL